MQAQTLNCPMCGAAASTDATLCQHCGARLATVACPSCFGLMFVGEKFCSHCGAKAERAENAAAQAEKCPRCKIEMTPVAIGNTYVRECPRCEGLWVDVASLEQICHDREKQSVVLGVASHLPLASPGTVETNIRYVPCPACRQLMNRVNFAKCSNVIVDVCREHGTWFDRDELRRIVEFIRDGGMDRAREREISDLEEKRHRLRDQQIANLAGPPDFDRTLHYDALTLGVSAAAAAARFLMKGW